MNLKIKRQRFIDYSHTTQEPKAKSLVFQGYYESIVREMQRTGAWRQNVRFLDVGCGLGLYTEYFHLRGLQTTGTDLNPDVVSLARTRAREKGYAIRYEVGTADRLPFEDQSFDVVFANSLLEHVDVWEDCVEEWIRILAPGGLLWIVTTNVIHPRQREFRWLPMYSWWPIYLKRIVVHLACGPVPSLANYTQWPALHWFSFFQLRRFLAERGLMVRDRFDCMDLASISTSKKFIRSLALSCDFGRWSAYLLVPGLIILATKPSNGLIRDSLSQ